MWLRSLRSNGDTVYSGWYGSAEDLSLAKHRSISVAFPLPNGSLTVFLRPVVDEEGALVAQLAIVKPRRRRAYLVVADHDRRTAWVRRGPLAERLRVFVDEKGVLRSDHALKLWTVPVIWLHSRLQRLAASTGWCSAG